MVSLLARCILEAAVSREVVGVGVLAAIAVLLSLIALARGKTNSLLEKAQQEQAERAAKAHAAAQTADDE